MVTVRTYWSPVGAALAKSLLDNYEIPCALLDENSSVYSRGGQFAVPIRLVVDENEVARAISILNGDFERAAKFETGEEVPNVQADEPMVGNTNRNPWELLVLAFYLAVPAICLICTKFPNEAGGVWGRYYIARATITQFLSWLALVFAGVLIAVYAQVRRSYTANDDL